MASILSFPRFKAFDSNGELLAGGKLYTYEAGTTTPQAAYADRDATTPLTNPVVLDSSGEATIYLSGTYKLVLTDANDVTQWTLDDISGTDVAYAVAADVADGTSASLAITPSALAGIYQYDYIYIPAASITPRSTNGASTGTAEYATNKTSVDILAFDDTTEEYAEFQMVMPAGWDRSTVRLRPYWIPAGSTGTAGQTCDWKFSAKAVGDDDGIDSATGTAQTVSDALMSGKNAVVHVADPCPALTVTGSPTLNDLVHFVVSRSVSTDNMVGDAWLLGVNLQYRRNQVVAAWS